MSYDLCVISITISITLTLPLPVWLSVSLTLSISMGMNVSRRSWVMSESLNVIVTSKAKSKC